MFTQTDNSLSQRINLYKCLRERLNLYIDLYVSLHDKDYPAFQWINLYKFSQERLILCINLYVSVHAKTNSLYKFM